MNLKRPMVPFVPDRADVHSVRAILAHRKLPNELVLAILDHARYWVEHEENRADYKVLLEEDFSPSFTAACPYYAMLAFPQRHQVESEALKIKEIEFLVVSHGKLDNQSFHTQLH
jgi:hypothetical protein